MPASSPTRRILAQPDLEIGFALRREERVERAHLGLVVGAAADRVRRRARELAVGRLAVAQRRKARRDADSPAGASGRQR